VSNYEYDWAPLYKESSPNAAIPEVMDSAIPVLLMRKNKYPCQFSGKLKFYIKNKNYFYRQF
jgi:hypothetical protein